MVAGFASESLAGFNRNSQIHANTDGSNRLFEIALCAPGEAVHLVPEPQSKHDPSAVAVVSARGIQIGYLSAERCGWIGAKLRMGEDIRAIFQAKATGGALIRISFTGADPTLPVVVSHRSSPRRPPDWDDAFYPDEIWPDE